MNVQLPDAVATFFAVSNGAADSALEHCFDEEATVRDEHHTHQGREAILAWLQEAQRKYAYRVDPVSVTQQDDKANTLAVRTTVSGNFPGSPVQLDHLFQLNHDRITSLEIR